MIFKSLNNFGRTLVETIILGFRSKELVISIKCVLKISDCLLLSETMQSFSEIIMLLKKFSLCGKCAEYGLTL